MMEQDGVSGFDRRGGKIKGRGAATIAAALRRRVRRHGAAGREDDEEHRQIAGDAGADFARIR